MTINSCVVMNVVQIMWHSLVFLSQISFWDPMITNPMIPVLLFYKCTTHNAVRKNHNNNKCSRNRSVSALWLQHFAPAKQVPLRGSILTMLSLIVIITIIGFLPFLSVPFWGTKGGSHNVKIMK